LEAGGEPPDEAVIRELWEALKAALIGELKRRGLWESPPAYLGVFGARSWRPEPGGGEDPVDELLSEAYSHLFVERLRALLAQLLVKDNVDGVVFLSLRQFLHERQREADPLGSRVYEALHGAIRQAVAGGEARVLAGDPRVRNDTVLGFGPADATAEDSGVELGALLRRWNDELLPDLVTAHGAGRLPVLGRLQALLSELPGQGVEVVRFRDLLEPLRDDARARWAAVLERSGAVAAEAEAGPELAELASPLRPDRRLEDRESFEKLVRCVYRLIAQPDGTQADREELRRLWTYLRTWASGLAGEEEALPSQRRLAELLRISRDRLRSLLARLALLVRRCQAEISAKLRVLTTEGGETPLVPPRSAS
jgi:hypothetical protein